MKTTYARHLAAALLPLLLLATACDTGGALSETDPTVTGPVEAIPEAFTIRSVSAPVAVSPTVSEGTFKAFGAIEDEGTVREELDSSEPLNHRSSIYGVKTLVSDKGTITIQFYAGLSPIGQNRLRAHGGFSIVEGSGAYAGLQGGGQIDLELAANDSPVKLTEVLEGEVQVLP